MVALPPGVGVGGLDMNGNIDYGQPKQPPQFSPVYPQQQMGTGNPAMDSLQSQLQGRQDFLNQAKMQDVNDQWQRTLASQNGFGTRYQQGRLQGQQLFNDILAPMMAGPGAGGAQGAYEFIKDTNKRIDDGMAQQTNERLKTTQALSNLADIAHKADAGTFAKMGQTIALHKAAAEINDRLSMQQWHQAQTQGAQIDAEEKRRTLEDKVKQSGEKTTQALLGTQKDIQDLSRAHSEAYKSYVDSYQKVQQYKQSIALAPSEQENAKLKNELEKLKISGQSVANLEAEINRGRAQQQGNNEQIKASNEQAAAGNAAKESGARVKHIEAQTETEQARGKAWGNKAAGYDPKKQQEANAYVQRFKRLGMPEAEMLKYAKDEKDETKKQMLLDAIEREHPPDDTDKPVED
jgi:hypothetical protein